MAKSTYRTTFADGSYIDKDAESADLAKAQSKNERVAEVDPGRSMQTADLRRHNRVQVTSVRELTEDERQPRRGAGRESGMPRNDAPRDDRQAGGEPRDRDRDREDRERRDREDRERRDRDEGERRDREERAGRDRDDRERRDRDDDDRPPAPPVNPT